MTRLASSKNTLINNPRAGAFFLGVLAASGFAPLFWWPVSLVTLGLLLALVFGPWQPPTPLNTKKVFALTWLFGFGFSAASLWWMMGAFRYTGIGGWGLFAAPFAILALSAIMALWTAAPLTLAYALKRFLPVALLPLLIAGLWVGAEFIRALSIYGLPWHLFGYIFAGHDVLLQPAALGGVFLLSFLGVLLPASLAAGKNRLVLIYIPIILGFFIWGGWRLYNAPGMQAVANVTIIQPNVPQDRKWQTSALELTQEVFEHLAASPKDTDLTVLPETALTFLKQAAPGIGEIINGYTPKGSGLVLGIPTKENGFYFNGALSFSTTGEELDLFAKKLLVPFGEFVPLKSFLPAFIQQFAPGSTYSPGQGARTLETSIGKALPLICYEAIFPLHLKKAEKETNPLFMLNITNDGWFAGTTGPHQHFAISRVRSVETGLTQIRAANTGISGFIDGYGRVIKRLDVEQFGYLRSSVFEQIK